MACNIRFLVLNVNIASATDRNVCASSFHSSSFDHLSSLVCLKIFLILGGQRRLGSHPSKIARAKRAFRATDEGGRVLEVNAYRVAHYIGNVGSGELPLIMAPPHQDLRNRKLHLPRLHEHSGVWSERSLFYAYAWKPTFFLLGGDEWQMMPCLVWTSPPAFAFVDSPFSFSFCILPVDNIPLQGD